MEEMLAAILDAYPYRLVYATRDHIVRYMNKAAHLRYGDKVAIGQSLLLCHNEASREKIEVFLSRADAGENEMLEVVNETKGERAFFTPVRNKEGKVIGYFERHEVHWDY